MPVRLTPDQVSEALDAAVREVETARTPEEGLKGLLGRLVPALADRGRVLVVGSDGRLHTLATADDGGVEAGSDGSSVPLGSPDHPAALACRSGEPTVRPADDGTGAAGWPETNGEAQDVALPLLRRGEPVGVLQLRVDTGERFGPGDLGYLGEVGERVSLVLENARLRRQVQDARRAKADFLSVMSHELRTPLTAVVGYADLLEAGIPGPVTPRQAVQLHRIKESAWDLLELIDGILGYARFEGEEPQLELGPVRPADLIEDALALNRRSITAKGLQLRTAVPDELPVVRTDREKAVRILFHLLGNAEKFTPDGTVTVSASASEDGERLFVDVADTGLGIPEESLEAIFEPFWQGERPETRTTGGTGMGLALARRIARLLGGDVTVRSTPGEGSTFRVDLPVGGPTPTL